MYRSDPTPGDTQNPSNKDSQSGTTPQPQAQQTPQGQQPGQPAQPGQPTQPAQQPTQQAAPKQTPPQQPGAQKTPPNGTSPDSGLPKYNWKPKKSHAGMLVALVALVIIAAVGYYAYFYYFYHATVTPPPVNTTNTTKVTMSTKILGCESINTPGVYTVEQNISTGISQGPCLEIGSSNVWVEGDDHSITGDGPYTASASPTYAVRINGASNVVIDLLNISKFSYGVYVNKSDGASIGNSSIKISTLSGVYIFDSVGTTLFHDNVSQVASNTGAIALQGGSGSQITNTLIQDNAYYGIYVNSSGNKFAGDKMLNNPVDLFCNSTNGFRSYNNFTGTSCNFNSGCNFARCSQTNAPYNTSSVWLSTSNIDNCGFINTSGTYTLQHNLYLNSYVNLTLPGQKNIPCLSIETPNVKLNCNGYSIDNAGFAIYLYGGYVGIFNISMSNCRFTNDSYGIYANHVFAPNVTNMKYNNTNYGIYFNNVTTGEIDNVTASKNDYAIYLNTTTGVTYTNLHLMDNTYGIYVDNGGSNIYKDDQLLNNTNADLYCSRTTYNLTENIYEGVSCGVTDCDWGTSCSVHKLPPLKTFYLTGCTTITGAGDYALSSSILGGANCMNIQANNVSFTCNGHNLISDTGTGSGFEVSGADNVSINYCNVIGYQTGVSVSNSNNIVVSNLAINDTVAPVTFNNVAYSKLLNVSDINFKSTGFLFDRVSNSIIRNDSANEGANSSSGFEFNNSYNDVVSFDSANSNQGNGFVFASSKYNSVYNNTALDNILDDYYCTPNSSGMYANFNGIDTGHTKVGCTWMVEQQNDPLLRPTCEAINSPGKTVMASDMVYAYGGTCFSTYNSKNLSANNYVFDCNGHTILATHGGTFFDAINTTGVILENCYLEGFTTPVISTANAINVWNDTIDSSNVSVLLTNLYLPNVTDDIFSNDSYGVVGQTVRGGNIEHNFFTNTNISVELINSNSMNVSYNSGNAKSVGVYLISSKNNQVSNNLITAPNPVLNSTSSK